MELSSVANIASIVVAIIVMLGVVMYVERRFASIEEKIKEIEKMRDMIEKLKEKSWVMEGELCTLKLTKQDKQGY
ncbi:hypothetical protein KKE26_10110 [bacterium]|nr:hypothetical protein [bacterium]MBU1753046.1 hypothetical protein [bacterium]